MESSLKDGWQVEEVNGKKMLAIYAHGERIQLHELDDFSETLSSELEKKSGLIDGKKHLESFPSFLHQVDFNEFILDDQTLYKFNDPVMRNILDSFSTEKFLLVVKSRQVYMSTILCLYSIWKAAIHGEKVFFLTTNTDSARRTESRMDRIMNSPSVLKLTKLTKSNRKSGNRFMFKSGGTITCKGSNPHAGKGEAIDLLIWDEAAFIADDHEMALSLFRSVSFSKKSQIIMASTPNAKSGVFYNAYASSKISEKNSNFKVKIVDKTTARNYKFRKQDIILKFQIPALSDISKYKVIALDNIYYRDEKIVDRFSDLVINQKYRDNIDLSSKFVDLLVSVKIPSQESNPNMVNCGYNYDITKFGIDFALVEIDFAQDNKAKIIEAPFHQIKNGALKGKMKTPVADIDIDELSKEAVELENLFIPDRINEETGYKKLSNGKIIFDMDRFPIYNNQQQIHVELNCEFRKIPLKVSNGNKTISMRMSGEMLDKIDEKIDEMSILTKREISLSDYLRGLIKKDLD